jgi:hypothetical protein
MRSVLLGCVLLATACGSSESPADTSEPACAESWICTPWEAAAGSDMATRTCTDSNNAGTTACKPDVGPTALPALDLELYKCQVHPILQRGCSMLGCHGTETGRAYRIYARGRLRNNQVVNRTGTCLPTTGTVNLAEAGTGTVMCEGWLPHTTEEWKKSFDSARSFMINKAMPDVAELLTQPTIGGPAHAGVKPWRRTDPDYLTVKGWLGGARLGSTCDTGKN